MHVRRSENGPSERTPYVCMASIGHLYGNAGLQQLLQDSGLYAAVTAQEILLRTDFDHGLHAMKLIDGMLYSQWETLRTLSQKTNWY